MSNVSESLIIQGLRMQNKLINAGLSFDKIPLETSPSKTFASHTQASSVSRLCITCPWLNQLLHLPHTLEELASVTRTTEPSWSDAFLSYSLSSTYSWFSRCFENLLLFGTY